MLGMPLRRKGQIEGQSQSLAKAKARALGISRTIGLMNRSRPRNQLWSPRSASAFSSCFLLSSSHEYSHTLMSLPSLISIVCSEDICPYIVLVL